MPTARLNPIPPDQLVAVTPHAAGDLLGVRSEKVYAALASGDLKAYRVGVRKLVLVEDLKRWLRDRKPATFHPTVKTLLRRVRQKLGREGLLHSDVAKRVLAILEAEARGDTITKTQHTGDSNGR